MPTLHIIVASTSGHTEYVVDTLIAELQKKRPQLSVEKQRAELAKPEDLLRGDVLLLATSSWNTGSIEGQLNPHMHAFLKERAANIDLGGKNVAVIGLGDHRYYYTAKAADHLIDFVRTHNGVLIEPVLRIINEPYGQEKIVQEWGKEFLSAIIL
ncbi:MAG TPA: flavodoxin family protein [Candidatus Peribacteraceae bacterium]|nr:flavodoxin family protein [Candidatus Peribacteraceae bacterium]